MRKEGLFFLLLITFELQIITTKQPDIITSSSSSEATSENDIGNASSTSVASSVANDNKIIQVITPSESLIAITPSDSMISSVIEVPQNCFPIPFKPLEKQALDIGLSSKGEMFTIGVDGKLYYYNFLSKTFSYVPSPGNLAKVSVAFTGTPFIVTTSGETYYSDCSHSWIKLPGCATDIAVGRGGEIFKLGCDISGNGFSLYKLQCESNSKILGCTQMKSWYCDGCNYDERKTKSNNECSWFKLSGSGISLAAAPSGSPVLLDINGNIIIYKETDWYSLASNINAIDISSSNTGDIFYCDNENRIFKLNHDGSHLRICGSCRGISVGPFNQPYIINKEYIVEEVSQC